MEEIKMSEVVAEVKNANEEELREVIEEHFKQMRNQGMKIGARYISVAVYDIIQKHIHKKTGAKASLRDYQRCVDDIIKILSVQLTQQNDFNKKSEDDGNDGTAE